jgi:hypothetical protein
MQAERSKLTIGKGGGRRIDEGGTYLHALAERSHPVYMALALSTVVKSHPRMPLRPASRPRIPSASPASFVFPRERP